MTDIDEKTVEYVLENRKYFEDLRQVTAQLAGLLVLAAAGSPSAVPDHPLLETAGRLFQNAVAGLRSTRVPVRTRTHHDALLRAAAAVGHALDAAHDGLGGHGRAVDIDPILVPLRAAYAHLQRAADALPGFDMIAFDQGCCGVHRTPSHRLEPALRPPVPRLPAAAWVENESNDERAGHASAGPVEGPARGAPHVRIEQRR